MKTILVFEQTSSEKHNELIEKYPDFHFIFGDDPAWKNALNQASAIIGFPPEEIRDQLKELPMLELIQLPFAGYEGWPELVSCPLANASGIYGLAISEYIIGALLSVFRHFEQLRVQKKQKVWNRQIGNVDSISGKTILILGCGDVGGTFARKAKALGARTIGAARSVRPIEGFDEVIPLDDIESVIGQADIVVGALPSNSGTHHRLNLEHFKAMKSDSVFVNVGRGDLVALSDLEQAMKENQIGHMILDVCEIEPLPQASPLWDDERVMITPHISGDFSLPRTGVLLWELIEKNLDALRDGRPLLNIVNR